MNDSMLDPRTFGARTGHSVADIERLVRTVLHSALGLQSDGPAVPASLPRVAGTAATADSALSLPHSAQIKEVDDAVRSVLKELRGGPRPGRSPGDAEVFADRLLSLRHAEMLPVGMREVRIAPGTVVTPLARDFLKRRGITLRWVSHAEAGRVGDRGEWGFAVEAESGVLAALRRVLLDEDWSEVATSLDVTARWIVEAPHRGALLLTDEASVAVWRACRFEGVRAASAAEPEAVARAVRRLGVNLLVVEPAGKSIALMRQLGRTFRRAGAPRAPDGLEIAGEARP